MASDGNPTTEQWILVIEDDRDLRDAVAMGLTHAGFRVVKAGTVAEANAKLTQQHFDCVVTDLFLEKATRARSSHRCDSVAVKIPVYRFY